MHAVYSMVNGTGQDIKIHHISVVLSVARQHHHI